MDNQQKNFWQIFGDWLATKQSQKEFSKQSSWLPTPGNIIFTLLALALFAVFQQAWATPQAAVSTVNPTINYQGRLADSGGVPINGNVVMSFAIFDAPSSGNLLWGPETHATVPVADGLFNVGLGSLTGGGIPATVWQGGDRYLQITVAGETLAPREMIRSVPTAITSEHALTADLALTVPDGSITSSNLNITTGTTCLPANRNINTAGNYEIVNVPNFTLNFALTQPSKVLIWFDGLAQFSTPTTQASVYLTVNGDRTSASYGDQNDVWFQVKGQRILNLGSGNHTIGLAINSQAAGTMTIHGSDAFKTCVNYLILGE